ncbi:hypothetical protein BH09BAC5_BH09BAC5_25660 [soil metagenome]
MKTLLFILAFSFGTVYANAQKMNAADVPSAVTTNFASKFPGAEKVKWEKEGENFEAEFELNEVETSAVYTSAGALQETEVEVAKSSLPASAMEYMSKNVAGAKIKEVSKITDASGKVTWEVEANKKDYIFDESGAFVKTVEGD